MARLNSDFDILRGWPKGSAVAEDCDVGGTSSHPHKAGTWVSLKAATPKVTTSNDALPSSGRGSPVALIIEGYEDFSAQAVGRTTSIMCGGSVIRLANDDGYEMFWTLVDDNGNGTATEDITADYLPGIPVKVQDGKIAPAFRTVTAGGGNALIGGATIAAAGALTADDWNNAAEAAETAMNIAVLNAESAIVGHVLRYDSTDKVLEVFFK